MDQEHEANSPQPRLDDSGEYMLLSPEEIRPFGKAAPKKGPTRKKRKSEIYTDTPVKKALEAEAKAKKQPKRKLPCKAKKALNMQPSKPET